MEKQEWDYFLFFVCLFLGEVKDFWLFCGTVLNCILNLYFKCRAPVGGVRAVSGCVNVCTDTLQGYTWWHLGLFAGSCCSLGCSGLCLKLGCHF